MSAPIDTQFYAPRVPVSIVALPGSYEVQAIRALLEMLGCTVAVHWIGTPSDFLKVLGQGESAPPYLFIAGHGDEEDGFYLGEYADFIDTSMMRGEHLPAEAIEPIVDLPGCTVITSACDGGSETMGWAFTSRGRCKAYIGCRVAPYGAAMDLFTVNFFYNVMHRKLSDVEAWRRAVAATDNPAIYEVSFFHPDGSEERFPPAVG